MERRDFLRGVAGMGATALLAASCSRFGLKEESLEAEAPRSSGGFTFVHITDQHVQKKRRGNEGYLACIESIKRIRPMPHFAVMGGDLAFDGNYNPKEKFIEEIKIYRDVSNELGIPYFHCMGNHDTLGLSPRRKVPVTDPDLGKKCIMKMLDWPSSYYSFDYRGWHFVILDCIKQIDHPENGPIYTPEIDGDQLEWLAADLGRAGGRPAIAFTHVAAFCNVGQLSGNPKRKAMDGSMVINNNKELRHILERHNVKALVQGHSHDIQEFFYNGVWYVTSASASAAWWGGNWLGFEPGYTIFRCDRDRLSWEHRTYEWRHHLEPEDTLERERIEQQREFEQKQKALYQSDVIAGRFREPNPLPKLNTGSPARFG